MANYNLKIIDNKVIFDGHAENQSDCHTLTLLCNLLEKNTKTIDYKMGYAEFELDDLPSENKFWLNDSKTFSINGTMVSVNATQVTSDAFITADNLSINLSFSQEGVTVHNVGNLQAQAKLGSELDLNSYFSITSIPSIAPGGTALLPFLDNIRLRSIVSNDGQDISEGDIISEDGTKLTVSKIRSIDLTTLSGWASLSPGSYSITIVAKADGYRDSEPSAAVSVTKQGGGAVTPKLTKGTWRWLTPYDMSYEMLKECENNATVTEFTSGGKTFTGFEFDARTGNVAYSSDTEHVDVISCLDYYVNETYKDITVTQDFDLSEDDFLYTAIYSELLTKLS